MNEEQDIIKKLENIFAQNLKTGNMNKNIDFLKWI